MRDAPGVVIADRSVSPDPADSARPQTGLPIAPGGYKSRRATIAMPSLATQ